LQLRDDFETKIEEVLIGVPNLPIKSNSKLKYNGWIMPPFINIRNMEKEV